MLNSQELALATAPIESARGLPNHCYTSEEAFKADRDKVFATTWAGLCFKTDLPKDQFAMPIDFMGLPLLVVKNSTGGIEVFHNVCRHRGMTLMDEPGEVKKHIRCPYHGWSYSLSGELEITPNIGGTGVHTHPCFANENANLSKVRAYVWQDIVFINLDGQAESFEDYIAPLENRWREYLGGEGVNAYVLAENGKNQLNVNSNWKLAVENYLESYHLPTVHPELNRTSPLKQHYIIEPVDHMHGQGSLCYKQKSKSASLPTNQNWPEDKFHIAEYPVLYPNVLLGVHADHFFVMLIRPLSYDRSEENVRIYTLPEGANDDTYQGRRKEIADGWANVFLEDVFAVERMQVGRSSPGFDGGIMSPAMDTTTHHFHGWVAKKLGS